MRQVRPEYFTEKGQWEKWLELLITDAEKQLTENQHNSNLKPKHIERLRSKLKLLKEARTNYLKKPLQSPPTPNNNSQLSIVKSSAKSQIQAELSKHNLKNTDLPSELQN